jgi:zinc protease
MAHPVLWFVTVALFLAMGRVSFDAWASDGGLRLPVQGFQLDNGLQVLVHEDHSNPLVAVSVLYHVGSAREEPGKTGFAHLFEHIMFQRSEHVGPDEFFRRITEAGGTLNGGTWKDGTIYYQVVPSNTLEMVMWMESDRMGFLLGALDEESFYNQQMVVLNEKKQSYDNRPYGHAGTLVDLHLYPEGHPYRWQTIGSAEDVASATLEDARGFFRQWYGPNNATLVLAGDVTLEQARALAEKYFGEIPSGPKPKKRRGPRGVLRESTVLLYEDPVARVPELRIVWPTVPQNHPDEPALTFLAEVLAEGKSAPLYRELVEKRRLTGKVHASHQTEELAGTFQLRIRSFEGASIGPVLEAVDEVLGEFSRKDVEEVRLQRIKAQFETVFYRRLETVFMKSMLLALYSVFAGDPGYVHKDLERHKAVSPKDVWRVYRRYLQNRPRVVLAVVPKGRGDLGVPKASPVVVPEEPVVEPRRPTVGEPREELRTPSRLDRASAPDPGPAAAPLFPTISVHDLGCGWDLALVTRTGLPLVQFEIDIPGGHLLDPMELTGLAHVTAAMLREGTNRLNAAQFEEAMELLGASLTVEAGFESFQVRVSCPAQHLAKVVDLVRELLLTPALTQSSLQQVKDRVRAEIQQARANPEWVASITAQRLLYGSDHIWGTSIRGDLASLERIQLNDVRRFHASALRGRRGTVLVAGDTASDTCVALFSELATGWGETDPTPLPAPVQTNASPGGLYVVPFPGASQSVIHQGRLTGITATHPDYYPLTVMNFSLGGDFTSTLNMVLREEKGYTYGIRTQFFAGRLTGRFLGQVSVQASATSESLEIIRGAMEAFGQTGVPGILLQLSRSALLNSMPRELESLGQLLDALHDIVVLGLPETYLSLRQHVLQTISEEDTARLSRQYLPLDEIVTVVVADPETIRTQFEEGSYTVLDLPD